MRKHISKLAVVASVLMLTSAFAAYSVGVHVDARMRAVVNGGGAALDSAHTYDDTEINASASVDNVSASVGFEKKGAAIGINSFNLTVSDLFGGLLTLRFFEWGYAAGSSYDEGDYILSDKTFTGVYATIKPIDMLSIGIGYGVASGEGNEYTTGVATSANEDSVVTAIGGTHGIKLVVGITGTGYPVNIYFGTVLNNGANGKQPVFKDEDADGNVSSTDVGDAAGTEFGVQSMSIGADVKLYQDYLDLGVGVVLPIGTAVNDEEFIAYVVLSGGASILDTGLSVNYALSYSTESEYRDAVGDFGFDDMLRVKLGLDWSAGIVTVGNSVSVRMADPDAAGDSQIDIVYEPTLNLSFASGMSVKFLYELSAAGVAGVPEGTDVTLTHTLGMNVGATFGVSSE